MSGLVRVRVGDLAEQVRGVSYGKEDASRIPQDGYLPVLRAGNITDEGLVFDDLVYVPSARISQKQLVQKGDVVIAASSGSLDVVGKAAPATIAFNGGFGAFCKVLRPSAKVDAAFFSHFFKTGDYRRKISSLAAGANINNLKNEHLDDLEFPLPPLPEQRRIAAILDQAETLRTQRRAALAQLDSLTQSIFLDMFGDPVINPQRWHRSRFADLLISIDSGWSPVCHDRPANEGEWGVLKLGAVTRCEFKSLENKALLDGVVPDPRIEVQEGDLLFSRKNTYELVAACALVSSTPPRLMMSDLIFRFRLKPHANAEAIYLHQLLIHPSKRREVQKLAAGSSSSMPNISKAKLADLQIETPPIALQQTFATRVRAIEALKAKHRAALFELDALFASLQHRAFNGELTAQAETQSKPRCFAELGQLNASKGLEALVYAAHRLPNKGHYWPLKVQYVADRRHLERHGRTLYGETHVAMPYGPVPQAAFNASRALAEGELICELPMDAVRTALRRDGETLVALRDADPVVLGADECESLDWAIRLVAGMSFDELKNQTHDSAWEKTPHNAPMDWQDIIATLAPAAQQRLLVTFE